MSLPGDQARRMTSPRQGSAQASNIMETFLLSLASSGDRRISHACAHKGHQFRAGLGKLPFLDF
jgi:hypothetical protein